MPLTHMLLLKTKNKEMLVRFASLTVVQDLFSSVKEDFLQVLPKLVPTVAELMEDESTEVEKLCQDIIKQIETLSGESLAQYLR